uniref:HDAg domain-containing protein n=1 Tax=Trichobilharzia regenti TaxID=157069 RepID=A0AA85ITL9_TRIRE|nr:unnamed protein product [Trichobilharzia regenti]
MGDLVKFVRQQFFDNNWTKSVDSNSLSEEKLECIDTSFAHMDVKSKLCLLLAFSNMKPSPVEKINKHIESIFLQALDEENNLVKAVATILHSKQTLNYLNFDISPTNEAFGKNIDKLLKSANSWSIVETPLLAEYLGSNVLDTFLSVKKSDSSEKEPNECGFRRRGKLESEHLKETYLEKLKDECQRRRVHVPIPGRSFARQDETEESITSEEVNNSGNSTNVSQSDSTSSKRKSTFPRISDRNSARLESKRSPVWSRNNLNKVGNNGENKPMSISDRINNRSSAMSAVRKPSGIKLLEFDELPAFGPKAKQLRKEKEREERLKLKQEKEERAREMKAAREASKLARQSERQALLEARKQNMFNPSLWSVNNHDEFSENIRTGGIQGVGGVGSGVGGSGDGMLPVVCRTSEFMNFNSSSISENRQSFTVLSKNFVANSQQSISNRVQYPGNFVNYTSMMNLPNRLISPKMNTDSKPVIHHPLLSASANTNSGNYVEYADDEDEEDDDDDDDDDDYDMMQNPESGTSCSIGFTNNLTFQCSVPAVSQAGVYTLSSNQSESTDKLPVSSLQQQAQPVQYLPFSNPSVSKSPSSTVSIAPAPVNHIRLIRPNVSQSTTTTGGVIKVVNAPSSDTPVRIICLMDQNTSKPTQNVIMQSGNPSNTDKLNESITHGSHENLALSSESPTYPVPTSGTQMLSPQRLVSIPSESSPVKIINSPVQPIRPRSDTTTGSLVCIAPRPPRIIQLSSANNSMFENTVTTQPILSSPGANRMYLSTSAYPAQQQQPQQQAASVGVIRPSNSTIVLDGRPIVFASPATRLTSPPAAPALRPQPVQRISVVASRPTVQSPTNQTYIQILPRPTVTTTQARPTNVAVLKPLNQSKIPMDSTDSTSSSASSAQITPTRQVIVSNAYNSINSGNNNLSSNINSNSNNNNVSNPCTIAPASIITSLSNYNSNQLTSGVIISQGGDVVQSSQPPSTPIVTGNIVVSSNTSSSNSSTSTNLSSVKIQDDLCLTESQLSVVQSLFQDANRVTRPEKAMIISFIAGSRDNPRPETGQITRIRLSEYRERVLNQTTGQLMDLAVDTYLTMDYSTGKYEKVKCYRTDTPENLVNLPLQSNVQ